MMKIYSQCQTFVCRLFACQSNLNPSYSYKMNFFFFSFLFWRKKSFAYIHSFCIWCDITCRLPSRLMKIAVSVDSSSFFLSSSACFFSHTIHLQSCSQVVLILFTWNSIEIISFSAFQCAKYVRSFHIFVVCVCDNDYLEVIIFKYLYDESWTECMIFFFFLFEIIQSSELSHSYRKTGESRSSIMKTNCRKISTKLEYD